MADFLTIGVMVAFGGSAAIAAGRKIVERRRARRALRRPVLDPTSSEGTEVRVTGTVRALDETLEAPLSGRRCVVYRSRVQVVRTIGSRAMRPNETLGIVPFVVDRGDAGSVLVDSKFALLDLEPLELPRPRGLSSAERTRRDRFLLLHGKDLRHAGRARFEEVVVEPGDTVSVSGLMMKDIAETPPDDERAFRDAPAPALVLAGNAEHPIAIGGPVG